MQKLLIAQLAHQVNKAYCHSIGDNSQLDWEQAPEWQKQSAINGVQFHLDNPDATPESSHENWLKEKTEQGWEYGEVKDVEKKLHPCFLPYDELPQTQRSKDYIFKSIIDTLRYVVEPVTFVNSEETETPPAPTFGEKLAGVSFNPSNNKQVDYVKSTAATFIDAIHKCHMENRVLDPMVDVIMIEAKMCAMQAQMLTVKAITWG